MDQEFYYSKGKKILLNKSNSLRAIQVNTESDEGKTNFESLRGPHSEGKGMDLGDGVVLLKQDPNAPINESMAGDELNVYEIENVETAVLTYNFIVKFKEGTSDEDIKKVIDKGKFGFKKLKFGDLRYLMWINNKEEYKKFLETVNDISNNEVSVEYAHPNFKRIQKMQAFPNDPDFHHQWALNKDNVDINIKAVWEQGIKGQGITIAIIDDGVDKFHEDLSVNGSPIPGYDSLLDVSDPSPANGDSHGTMCAGIAAAAGNNNIGICGVAPESIIYGVRVAQENNDAADTWLTDDVALANGILSAVAFKADVLSNSWFYGLPSQDLENALEHARKNGRDGKGCVIVFASGNYKEENGDHSVLFPGNLSHLGITVGAYNDEGKWVGDREDDIWKSRFGSEVKICAPGLHILTTDVMGRGDHGNGNYTRFSGTSAAAPHIAGVAALILSANNNLSADEVETILMETADFMDSQPPQKTGSGKVNAKKAVEMAMTM